MSYDSVYETGGLKKKNNVKGQTDHQRYPIDRIHYAYMHVKLSKIETWIFNASA